VNKKEKKKTINLDISTTVKTKQDFCVTRENLISKNENRILDDYEMDLNKNRILGKGTFGQVQKAVDKQTGITRAVKILIKESFNETELK